MFGTMKKALLVTATAGALSIGLAGSANANLINFQWDPNAVDAALTGTFGPYNNMQIGDFATIFIPNSGTGITETGAIQILDFQELNNPAINVPPGMNGAGGAADKFKLYFSFTSTSHLTGWNPNNLAATYNGAFDSLSYSLILDEKGKATFTDGTVVPHGDTQVTLAHGSLVAGVNTVSVSSGIPSAGVQASFTQDAGAFFITPPASVVLNLFAAFTNVGTSTLTQASCGGTCKDTTIKINGGGGNANFGSSVPEPGSLLLLGTGLLGFAGIRRRKRSRS